MVGIIVYAFNLFGKRSKIEPAFWSDLYNLFLSIVGILIISWILYDIHSYLAWLRNYCKNDEIQLKMVESDNGELIISVPLVKSQTKILPQYYCFLTGRHSGSFFLKIGAACFCIGHIIHNGVIFVRNVIGYIDDKGKYVCMYVTLRLPPTH